MDFDDNTEDDTFLGESIGRLEGQELMFSRRAAFLLATLVFLGGRTLVHGQAAFGKPVAVDGADEFGLRPPSRERNFPGAVRAILEGAVASGVAEGEEGRFSQGRIAARNAGQKSCHFRSELFLPLPAGCAIDRSTSKPNGPSGSVTTCHAFSHCCRPGGSTAMW